MDCMVYLTPLSMGFSRQEYWSGLPFPSPGDVPTQGLNPGLLGCRQTLHCLSHQGSPKTQKHRGKIVSLLLVDGAGPLAGDEVYRRSREWGMYALRDQCPNGRDLRRLDSSLSTLSDHSKKVADCKWEEGFIWEQTCLASDLGLLSLQNCEKALCSVFCFGSPRLIKTSITFTDKLHHGFCSPLSPGPAVKVDRPSY